jgi:hypothetical protein
MQLQMDSLEYSQHFAKDSMELTERLRIVAAQLKEPLTV